MTEYAFPVLFALFAWWFSTGVIIYLDGLPRRTFRWSMLGATIAAVLSLYGLASTSMDTSVAGAYLAFTYGLVIWGWQTVSFYLGYVTGTRKEPCPDGCSGYRHFGHAIQTSLYHELAIIASAALVVALTWGAPNQVGTWTFMVLWWMHASGKLNVFFGVRNLNEEFLPQHLRFLEGFLKKRPMNLLFPVSVTVSTVVAVALVQRAFAGTATPFEATGFTFLATLMSLAILEHWFLVLPLPSERLWSWGLKSHRAMQPFEVEIAVGFVGAGKTSFLSRRLGEVDPDTRTAALVDDFSALGIDASLLRRRGTEVIELPNGCICCSLQKDLAAQLKETIARWAPRKVFIESSGLADAASLLRILEQAEIKPMRKSLELYAVIDAGAFLRDYARLPDYFEAQARLAPVFVVNKIDLVPAAELQTVFDTLRTLNPNARIVQATYGVVADDALRSVTAEVATPAAESDPIERVEEAQAHARCGHHLRGGAYGLRAWSSRLDGACDPRHLRDLLEAIAAGCYGEVERVKGVAASGSGWLHFGVAGGQTHIAAFAPAGAEEPRVAAIGGAFDGSRLQTAFEACARAPGVAAAT